MKICIFGDSHTEYFAITPQLKYMRPVLKGVDAHLSITRGATILGLGRRKSTLNTLENINRALEVHRPDFALYNFGQVDIELGYYFRRVVKGEELTFHDFIEKLCASYSETLLGQGVHGLDKVVVKGVNVSVLTFFDRKKINYTKRIIAADSEKNAEMHDMYDQKLKQIMPSDDERYYMHLMFNRKLREMCDTIGAIYYDINEWICDPEQLCVRPELIPAKADHHLVDSLGVRWLYWRGLLECISI